MTLKLAKKSSLVIALMTTTHVPAAFAQEAGATAGPEVFDEIVVTGSRIQRSTASTPIPVTTIGENTIKYNANTQVSDLINELPSIRTTQSDANTNIGAEQEAGAAFIDLRGLGIDRTLVLVNGRRHVGGRPGSAAVDTNTLPIALVERIEVITGGASAVYGADAVSGVVNFIMKEDFEGLVFDGQAGVADRGDGERFSLSLTGGSNFNDDRGNAYFNVNYVNSGGIIGQDRDYANQRIRFATNPANTGPDDGIPDQILFSNTGFISTPPGGRVQFRDGAGTTIGRDFGGPFTFDSNGNLVPQNEGQLVESFLSIGGDDATDLSRFDSLQIPVERFLATAGGRYELGENIEAFGSIKYARTTAETAEQTTFSLPNLAPIIIRADNPFVPDALRTILTERGDEDFFVSRTNIDHGQRQSSSERETLQFVAGLKGTFSPNLDYSIHYQYGTTEIDATFINRQIASRFAQALDAVVDPTTSQIVCRDQSNGCVPINVLGPNAATPEALGFITEDFQTFGELKQQVVNATFTGNTQDFLDLQGGPIGFAFGGEYRKENTKSIEGFFRNTGDLFNAQPLDDTSGAFDVIEGFAEVVVPIVSDLPFAKSVNLEAAVRISDYSTIGSTVSWKVGGDWAPSSDLRFRVNISNAVRAPNIGELFAPNDISLQFLIDPCDTNNLGSGSSNRRTNCAAAGVPADFESQSQNANVTILTGGNPNLSEEEADSVTFGVVLTPDFIPNFTLAVDYYDIKISGAINGFPAQDVVNSCYDAESLDNPFCTLVTRQSNNQFDQISSTLINVASFETSGIDIDARYNFALEDLSSNLAGEMYFAFNGTYVDKLTFFGTPGGTANEEAGELGDPHFSFNFRTTYIWDKFTFSLEERYLGNQVFNNAEPAEVRFPNDTGSEWYTDIQFRYQMNEQIELYAGVDNLFDNAPPTIARVPEIRSFTGDSIIYNSIGRFVRGGVRVNF